MMKKTSEPIKHISKIADIDKQLMLEAIRTLTDEAKNAVRFKEQFSNYRESVIRMKPLVDKLFGDLIET